MYWVLDFNNYPSVLSCLLINFTLKSGSEFLASSKPHLFIFFSHVPAAAIHFSSNHISYSCNRLFVSVHLSPCNHFLWSSNTRTIQVQQRVRNQGTMHIPLGLLTEETALLDAIVIVGSHTSLQCRTFRHSLKVMNSSPVSVLLNFAISVSEQASWHSLLH